MSYARTHCLKVPYYPTLSSEPLGRVDTGQVRELPEELVVELILGVLSWLWFNTGCHEVHI